ncbi:hypothetical protein P9112_000415 [Eukaryota sp. TZLM1-RC]
MASTARFNVFPSGFAISQKRNERLYIKGRTIPKAPRFNYPEPPSSQDTSPTSSHQTFTTQTSPTMTDDSFPTTLTDEQLFFLRDYHSDPGSGMQFSTDDVSLETCEQALSLLRHRETDLLLGILTKEAATVDEPRPNWYCLKNKEFLVEQQRFKAFELFREDVERYRKLLWERAERLCNIS